MAYQTPCPQCLKVGFVRHEHVIKGTASTKQFYCGACQHQWTVAEGLPSVVESPRSSRLKRHQNLDSDRDP